MPHYYKLSCETIGRSDWWTHVSEPPALVPGPYWGFFPEIGNDEDGWGFVDIVYYQDDIWCGWRGDALEPQPLMWAEVNSPLVPLTARDQATARADALKAIQKPTEPEPP